MRHECVIARPEIHLADPGAGPMQRWLAPLVADGPVPIRISGACMEPAIADGALVTVARQRRYWPGDVLVFFAADGRLTAHRLVGAGRWRGAFRLFTRADNAPVIDTAILAADVVGRVVGGDCVPAVARVPVAQRLMSLGFFLRWALRRMLDRRRP